MRPVRIVSSLRHREPPEPGTGLRLSLFQAENPAGSPDAVMANLARMEEAVALAASYGTQLCVFPECFNTGYALGPDECRLLAESCVGQSVRLARKLSQQHGVGIVLPYVERSETGALHDSVAIAVGGRLCANYRKTHLYGAAERANFTPGDDLPPVVEVNGFPVGVLNCYECEFPPLYQSLADRGARLIVGPTAADRHFTLHDGTPTLVPYPDATEHIIPAMAAVWRVFVAYANRRGWEVSDRGQWEYRGNSGIWAPDGTAVVSAGPAERAVDSLLVADCLPQAVHPFSPEGDHLADSRMRPPEHLLPAG
ncbi:Predicted amidohydrolase [Saccharopolyspora kobensis]|uniref:Predicted amidohydrolase n=2 Tax=Saccharopolyspora kobensis TaxID=146035 RepID=A0A1H6AHI7_9PSEU|nr:nitrilase-related carbon-nitrogen hydrolase [Saccharopolyspora kobensis]SEG47614.1 Predicted amidohydrolase [Saccharopolyspora kobensis]SFE56612.1 Predicted amidohydrolase [Saccharopolyspora kobensis]